jgi:hypothetical protein
MRWLISTLAIAACASQSIPSVRYLNAPVVGAVDDRRDVPRPPEARDTQLWLYHFDGMFLRHVTRALELPRPQRALGVNALDEVPDSTWFTNRIGVRVMTLDELRRGPAVAGSPEPHKPWTIKSTKVGGRSIGFTIVDARGEKYLLKFDRKGYPETETAVDAIVGRLLWACGFNVPEDHVVSFRREELVLAKDAVEKGPLGRTRLTAEGVDRRLAQIHAGADGTIRGIASRILEGKWLGGHPGEGVRSDDPNDRIPHELRRDLRGAYAMFAWLDHTDVKEHNTLDMWVADPADPTRHYVKHYLIDFGKSLGFMAQSKHDPRIGHAYRLDYSDLLASFVTAGLYRRPWEGRSDPGLRGIALYDATAYDPSAWKPTVQTYTPFWTADRFDNFWGAKILIRFTRDQLRAVVDTGKLSDPRAVEYLVDALVARQRVTAKYWFDRVAPLDAFRIVPADVGHVLCFDDLAIEHGLASGPTRYAVAFFDRGGRPIAKPATIEPGAGPRTCRSLQFESGDGGYTMVQIDVTRPGMTAGMIVHIARDPVAGSPRVIGVWRR